MQNAVTFCFAANRPRAPYCCCTRLHNPMGRAVACKNSSSASLTTGRDHLLHQAALDIAVLYDSRRRLLFSQYAARGAGLQHRSIQRSPPVPEGACCCYLLPARCHCRRAAIYYFTCISRQLGCHADLHASCDDASVELLDFTVSCTSGKTKSTKFLQLRCKGVHVLHWRISSCCWVEFN